MSNSAFGLFHSVSLKFKTIVIAVYRVQIDREEERKYPAITIV